MNHERYKAIKKMSVDEIRAELESMTMDATFGRGAEADNDLLEYNLLLDNLIDAALARPNDVKIVLGSSWSNAARESEDFRRWLADTKRVSVMEDTPQKTSFASAVEAIQQEMKSNPYCAWSWHCNVAVAFQDAFDSLDSIQEISNKAASIFMKNAFDVDTYPGMLDEKEDDKA